MSNPKQTSSGGTRGLALKILYCRKKVVYKPHQLFYAFLHEMKTVLIFTWMGTRTSAWSRAK